MPVLEDQVRSERPEAGSQIEIHCDFFESTFTATMPDGDDEYIDFLDPRGPTIEEETESNGATQAIVVRIKFGE